MHGGNIASDYVDRYTTVAQKTAFKREAKNALGTARQFVPAGEKDIVDSLIHVIHGLGLGGKVGTDLGKRLAGITGDVVESAAERAMREMSGGKVNRLRKARKWEGFVADDVIPDGITAARNVNSLVQEIRNPVVSGLKNMFGFGMNGGLLKGSPEAKAHAAKMHAARRLKYVKGSDASKASNAKNPWLVFVKEFYDAHPEMTYREALSAASVQYRSEFRKKSAQYGGRKWAAKGSSSESAKLASIFD
jgi:hypothetical protein